MPKDSTLEDVKPNHVALEGIQVAGSSWQDRPLSDGDLEAISGASVFDDIGDFCKSAAKETLHYSAVANGWIFDLITRGGTQAHKTIPQFVDKITGRSE